MKRNILRAMVLIVLSTFLVAGCSKKDEVKEDNTGSGVETTVTVTATPEVTTPEVTDSNSKGEGSAAVKEPLPETDVYVFIAASLNNVVTKLADTYKETQPNVNIILNADSSGTLQTQIEEGAECDVFFSAAMKQMKALNEGGYIKDNSIKQLLENKVVLIKPMGTTTKVTGFENIFEAKNIALAGEDVPVGAYAREIFHYLGIWDQVSAMEINEAANVSAVLAAVSEASNEVGVVYATDANSVKDSVEVIAIAPNESLTSRVIYPVGLVKNVEADSIQEDASQDFIDFLSSEEAMKVFEEFGFNAYVE